MLINLRRYEAPLRDPLMRPQPKNIPFGNILSDKNLNVDDKMHLIDMLGNNRRDDERMRPPSSVRFERRTDRHAIRKREEFEDDDYYQDYLDNAIDDINFASETNGKIMTFVNI